MSSSKWYYSQFVLIMVRYFRLAHGLSVEIIFQVFVVLPIRSFSRHDKYGTIYQTLGNVYEKYARPRSGSPRPSGPAVREMTAAAFGHKSWSMIVQRDDAHCVFCHNRPLNRLCSHVKICDKLENLRMPAFPPFMYRALV